MALFSGITTLLALAQGTGLISGFTAAAIGFGLKLAVGLGLNKLAVKLAGGEPKAQPFGIKATLQRGADIPASFIVGAYATAGSLDYGNTWGEPNGTPNAYLTMVISLSDLPVQSLDGIWVNGVESTIGETADADKGFPITEFNKSGADHLWVKFYDGTQTTADAFLTDTVSTTERPWDATAIGTGVAYAIVTARINQTLFRGIPTLLFELTGVPLYDPSRDTTAGGTGAHRWADPATWSGDGDHFPVVMAYNIMRGISYDGAWFYGLQGTAQARLPDAGWIAAIEACRATIDSQAGTEPTYRAGGEIPVGAPASDAIEALLDACNGRLSEGGGTYTPFVGAPGSAVATITDDVILSTEEQSFTPFFGLADTVNGVTARFPDPASGWQVQSAPPLYDSDLEAEDGDRRLPVGVDLSMVPYGEQVQRLMKSALAEARRARRHTITLPPEYWVLEPGDVVSWTSARNGYVTKLFRVDGVADHPNANVTLDVTEVDPDDYDFDTDTDFTPYEPGGVSGTAVTSQEVYLFNAVKAVVPDATGANFLPAIRVTWSGGVDDIAAIEVQVRVAASGVQVFSARYDDFTAGAALISGPIKGATAYEVRGRYIPASPRDVEWTGWVSVTTDDVRIDPGFLSDETWNAIAEDARGIASVLDSDETVERLKTLAQSYRDRAADRDRVNTVSRDVRQLVTEDRLALSQLTETVSANLADASALVLSEKLARVDADGALASQITLIAAEAAANAALVALEQIARADGDSALAQSIALVDAKADANAASVITEQTARADGDSALASDITSLTSTVGGNTASITSTQTTVDGINAEYTLRIDVGGEVSGFVVRSDLNDLGEPASQVAFVADKFAIVGPGGGEVPFVVYASPTLVNGVTVPAGVYLKSAFIHEAMIQTAMIGDAQIDTLQIAGNAVTGQAHDYEAGPVSTLVEALLVDVTLARTAGYVTRLEISLQSTANDGQVLDLRTTRQIGAGSETDVRLLEQEAGAYGQIITFVVIDTDTTGGSTVYRVYGTTDFGGGGGAAISCTDITINAQQFKR